MGKINTSGTGGANRAKLQNLYAQESRKYKQYPAHVKTVLVKDCEYRILSAEYAGTRHGDIIHVTVCRRGGGLPILTYLTALYVQNLEIFYKKHKISLKDDPTLLQGYYFRYSGEVKTDKGNSYSSIEFIGGDGGDGDLLEDGALGTSEGKESSAE